MRIDDPTQFEDGRSPADYREQVKGPGKFEGCAPYVPFYWDAGCEGCADRDGDDPDAPTWIFDVTDRDRALFPELGIATEIELYEDDNGFVHEV